MEKSKFKKYIVITAIISVIIGLIVGVAIASSDLNNSSKLGSSYEKETEEGYGKGRGGGGMGMGMHHDDDYSTKENCLADGCLDVEDLDYPVEELTDEAIQALASALDDEYKAHATYEEVISKIGPTRPFSMIIRSEEHHISSLKAIYDKYGLEAPNNPYTGDISVPATYQEACQVGVDAEIANAALYEDKLLPAVEEYEDITEVFFHLMEASRDRHLPAFERCN